jgi:transcriptional regulator with XRE-family HTH domain
MLIATKPSQSATGGVLTVPEAIRACWEGRLAGQEELAERTGIPQQTISRLARGESSPKFQHLVAIEEACDRPRGWILTQAGFVTPATTVTEAIALDPDLDDKGRQILMDLYAGEVSRSKR